MIAAISLACASASVDAYAVTPVGWSFADVDEQAQKLAAAPFTPSPELPPDLKALNYDTYRLIVFEHLRAIWKNHAPFWLECFHRGYLFKDKVAINLIEGDKVAPLAFEPALFEYRGALSNLQFPADSGFAGFRVLGRFESSPNFLEIASFLGASYFRAIGEGQVYGSSARGLAIDIGLPKAEEFPVFREFWIERPAENDRALRFWALLDSPTVAGAYEFVMRPGPNTTCDIRARLHFRRTPEKLGLAPITSMWMWGAGRKGPADDPRPRVHDSDGLLVHTQDGEWIWRPLTRLSYPSLSHYDLAGVRGFGLMQRDRRPENFQDNEALYHRRPSVWIEPKSGWTKGAVELLELPADHEGIDNIAAWWVPAKQPQVGQPLDLEYRVSFSGVEPDHSVLERAVDTRVIRDAGKLRIEIDFQSPNGETATAQATPEVLVQRGTVQNVQCESVNKGVRQVSFEVVPEGEAPVELSVCLKQAGQVVSETWRYLCPN
jgi:glucans biosynthesis protein